MPRYCSRSSFSWDHGKSTQMFTKRKFTGAPGWKLQADSEFSPSLYSLLQPLLVHLGLPSLVKNCTMTASASVLAFNAAFSSSSLLWSWTVLGTYFGAGGGAFLIPASAFATVLDFQNSTLSSAPLGWCGPTWHPLIFWNSSQSNLCQGSTMKKIMITQWHCNKPTPFCNRGKSAFQGGSNRRQARYQIPKTFGGSRPACISILQSLSILWKTFVLFFRRFIDLMTTKMFLEFSNREILQTRFIIKKKVNLTRTSKFAKN
jgi:hypothetical protein